MTEVNPPVDSGTTTTETTAIEWLPQKLAYAVVIGSALFGIGWGLVNTLIVINHKVP